MQFFIKSMGNDVKITVRGKQYKFTSEGETVEMTKIQLQQLCTELVKRDYPDKNYSQRQKIAGIILCLAHYVTIKDEKNSRIVDVAGIGKKTYDINKIFESEEENEEFKAIQKSMSIKDCDNYLNKHTIKTPVYINGELDERLSNKVRSNGQYTQQVLQIKKRILDMESEAANLIAGEADSKRYERFIQEFPNHPEKDKLCQRLAEAKEQEEFMECMSSEESDKCDEFLLKYPDSKYKSQVEEIRLKAIKQELYTTAISGTIDECNAFLELYTQNDEIRESIQTRLNTLIDKEEMGADDEAADIALSGSLEDCEEYLQNFPNGKHAEKVKEKIIEIDYLQEYVDTMDAEESVFLAAMNGASDACDKYLTEYPEGKHVEVVNARKSELEAADKELEKAENTEGE